MRTAGHTPGSDQLALCIGANAADIAGRCRKIKHAQHADHLVEQARNLLQLGRIPAGLDVAHECGARLSEVADRLAHDEDQALARTRARHVAGIGIREPETRHLVFEGSFDEQQRAGDIEQCVLVGAAAAFDDLAHGVALGDDDATGDVESHHSKRVADLGQRLHLWTQLGDVRAVCTQVQVKHVLDPHEVFLDRAGHRVEQRAVAPGDAAACVGQFGFGRSTRVKLERLAQVDERGMLRLGPRRGEQQLPGGLSGQVLQVSVQACPHRMLDVGKRGPQRGRRSQRVIAQRGRHGRTDPQQPAQGFDGDIGKQGFSSGREGACILQT